MNIQIPALCRGELKNYFLVELSAVPEGATPSIEVHASKGGQRIPAFVTPFMAEEDQLYVVVVPDAPGVGLTFECSFPGGQSRKLLPKKVSGAQLSLKYSQIIWRSRIDCRKQRELCAELRRVGDAAFAQSSLTVDFTYCVQDADNHEDIVRSALTSRWSDDDIQLHWLNPDGTPYDKQTWPMGLNKSKSTHESEILGSQALFSSRMKRPENPIVVMASSKHQPAYTSFTLYTPEQHGALLGKMFDTIRSADLDSYYPEWFRIHKADEIALEYQRAAVFEPAPKFSVVVPLYKTPLNLFEEMVQSVIAQSYSCWELILVNSTPEVQELSERVAEYAAKDSRIRVVTLKENGGISENTNAGVAVATGDFVCFFDHDDLLEPDCLYEYACALRDYPDTDVLYCDEDKLLDDGSLVNPYFKTNFNLDLLRCNNYICHLMTIRASLLKELGPFQKKYDGAQDHAMVLAASEKARHIHHVPRILYHWRAAAGSTAASADNKSYATEAGIRAVSDHLARLNISAKVSSVGRPFTYRVRYDVPADNPLVSIIIPSKDHVDVLENCICSIRAKSTYKNYEIVVVDNGSTESETKAFYQRLESEMGDQFKLASYPHPFNFSAMMNIGAATAHGDYLLLLNNDTEVITPDWIEEMLGTCARTDVGAVGVRLFYRDGTIQHAGGFVADGMAWHSFVNLPKGYWGYFCLADQQQNTSLVTAACLMTKRSAYEAVGGFNEDLEVEYNDVDFCLKLREQGYLIAYTPYAELIHYECLSRGSNDDFNQWLRSYKETSYLNWRWADIFTAGDPYLNPNFNQSGYKLRYRSF